jgi:hypothetical protein
VCKLFQAWRIAQILVYYGAQAVVDKSCLSSENYLAYRNSTWISPVLREFDGTMPFSPKKSSGDLKQWWRFQQSSLGESSVYEFIGT